MLKIPPQNDSQSLSAEHIQSQFRITAPAPVADARIDCADNLNRSKQRKQSHKSPLSLFPPFPPVQSFPEASFSAEPRPSILKFTIVNLTFSILTPSPTSLQSSVIAVRSKGDNHRPEVPKGTACCSPRREPWVTKQPKNESPEGATGKTDVYRDRTSKLALAQTQHRQKQQARESLQINANVCSLSTPSA